MQEEIFGPVLVSGHLPHAGRGGATRQQHALRAGGDGLDGEPEPRPRHRAEARRRCRLGERHQPLRRRRPFGGVRESGFGREGGWEGMQAYTETRRRAETRQVGRPRAPAGDRRCARARPDGQDVCRRQAGAARWRLFQAVWSKRGKLLGHAGIGNRKDIRNAVEAARGARDGRRPRASAGADPLLHRREPLGPRGRIRRSHPRPDRHHRRARRGGGRNLRRPAVHLRRLGRQVRRRGEGRADPGRGAGHAGTGGRDRDPARTTRRLSALGLPARAGHRDGQPRRAGAVRPAPLAATDLYQVLDTSDVPGGVVNIVTGDPGELGGTLAGHLDVDALWSFSPRVDVRRSKRASAGNLKRTWINHAKATRTGCHRRAGGGASWMPRPRSRRSGCPTASNAAVCRALTCARRPSPSSWPSAPRARPRTGRSPGPRNVPRCARP
jgi:hypothetical protein